MWSSLLCFQLFYPIVPIVSIQSWKLLQYLNLSSQLSIIMKVKMWTFLQESIINGGRTCQLPLKHCEPFIIFIFQIWDLADTDGKGILNKQVWLFMWCITNHYPALKQDESWNFWFRKAVFLTDFSNRFFLILTGYVIPIWVEATIN